MTEQQYALVLNGSLVNGGDGNPIITGFHSEKPEGYAEHLPDGCEWLPITNVDSEPFNIRIHCREAPTYRVRGPIVERVYNIKRVR